MCKDNCENKTNIEKKKMNNLSMLFAAWGSFITGLFCILQYFFESYNLFKYFSIGAYFAILILAYSIACSKRSLKFHNFWYFINECANAVGWLNPIILAFSLVVAVIPDITFVIGLAIFVVAQLIIFIIVYKKVCLGNKSIFNKLLTILKNNVASIITAVLAAVFMILWMISNKENSISDLWLNLSSGFISSFITIVIVDRIIRKQKKQKELPLRKSMYRDIQLFTSRYVYLWKEMYEQCSMDRSEISVEDLFSEDKLEVIRNNLNLKKYPNVEPKQNWFMHIINQEKDLITRGEKILANYHNMLDPEIVHAIHYLVNDSALLGRLSLIERIYASDLNNKIPRPPLLCAYMVPVSKDDIKMTVRLIKWCRDQYSQFNREDCLNIYPVPTTFAFSSSAPSSIMTEQDKKRYYEGFEEWRKNQS